MFTEDDVIYVYDDERAVADGVLVALDKFTAAYALPRTAEGKVVNRVTRAVFDVFARELKDTYLVNFSEGKLEPSYDLSEVLAAAEAVLRGEPEEGMYVGEYKGRTLWLMENEVGGMTLMFPEDY